METRALFRKTEASMNELAANAGFTLLALRGALAEAEAEHLQAREAVNWQDRASVQAAKHAFERVSAISLAVQGCLGYRHRGTVRPPVARPQEYGVGGLRRKKRDRGLKTRG